MKIFLFSSTQMTIRIRSYKTPISNFFVFFTSYRIGNSVKLNNREKFSLGWLKYVTIIYWNFNTFILILKRHNLNIGFYTKKSAYLNIQWNSRHKVCIFKEIFENSKMFRNNFQVKRSSCLLGISFNLL